MDYLTTSCDNQQQVKPLHDFGTDASREATRLNIDCTSDSNINKQNINQNKTNRTNYTHTNTSSILLQDIDRYIQENERDFRQFTLTYNMKFKLFMSEFLGTFVLVYLSQTALTSFGLLGTQNDIINRKFFTIIAYGLSYLLVSLMTLNLSGAHLNPAYTFASATCGGNNSLKWSLAAIYILAQYLGSFMAAIFLHATYSDKLAQRHAEGLLIGMNSSLRAHGNIYSTGKFFSSYPPTEVSLTQLYVSYALATAMLTCFIHTIYKSKLVRIPRSLRPIYLASAHCLVMAAFAANGGPVFNPAQDFSPRLYICLFGWGVSAINLYNYKYWWLCGIIAPHVGALIGMALYKILDHLRTIRDTDNKFNDDTGDALSSEDNYNRRTYDNNYHRPAPRRW